MSVTEKIEILRESLYQMAHYNRFTDEEMLRISRELDQLIVQLMKTPCKGKYAFPGLEKADS